MLRHKPPSEQSATQAVTGGSLASASVTCTRTCRRVRGASRRSCGLVSGESGEVGSMVSFSKDFRRALVSTSMDGLRQSVKDWNQPGPVAIASGERSVLEAPRYRGVITNRAHPDLDGKNRL